MQQLTQTVIPHVRVPAELHSNVFLEKTALRIRESVALGASVREHHWRRVRHSRRWNVYNIVFRWNTILLLVCGLMLHTSSGPSLDFSRLNEVDGGVEELSCGGAVGDECGSDDRCALLSLGEGTRVLRREALRLAVEHDTVTVLELILDKTLAILEENRSDGGLKQRAKAAYLNSSNDGLPLLEPVELHENFKLHAGRFFKHSTPGCVRLTKRRTNG